MRKGNASRTAKWVTYVRGLAHAGFTQVQGFKDPVARELLDTGWRRLLDGTEAVLKRRRFDGLLRDEVDLLALRTVVIDEAVREALARGVKQIVILGAGLDGRAWRLPLTGVRVFEVDHPDTQRYKRAQLGALESTAERVDFVPVDFEKTSLGEALDAAGHDCGAPTVWIWEGVVMYLTPEAVQATLRAIAVRSAAGSTLVVNYHTAFRISPVRLLLRAIGELDRSAYSVEEMRARLGSAGFEVSRDEGVEEWTARYGGNTRAYDAARTCRIVTSRRQAGAFVRQ
jgi:methyltransferase (TIGR00027 family)